MKKIELPGRSCGQVFSKNAPRSIKFAQSEKNPTDLRKINAQAKVKLPLEHLKLFLQEALATGIFEKSEKFF